MAGGGPAPAGDVADGVKRAGWAETRRRITERRYDELHAAHYDESYGEIGATHRRFVTQVLQELPDGSRVLDAPCGTGKYWPMILAAGHEVVGVDQSREMLRIASAKHPTVKAIRTPLQDLAVDGRFAAALCIDSMEFVPPEEWPLVLERLAAAVDRGGGIYLTVELPEGEDLESDFATGRAAGLPVVWGESVGEDGGYHYFPPEEAVHRWFARAGLRIRERADGDGYRHYLLARADAG